MKNLLSQLMILEKYVTGFWNENIVEETIYY